MTKKAEANFGGMLTEAIYTIKKCQHKSIAIVQDELGYALEPIRTGSAVERWRYGAMPPTVVDVEDLARAVIKHSCHHFDRDWLYDFLVSAGHPYPEKLCQQLFPLSDKQDEITGRQPPGRTQSQANRERSQLILIERVKKFWIQGVLEQSIHRHVLLGLKLEERPDLIICPWDAILQIPNQPERFLSSEMRMIDIFDEMNRAMLVLGEPGAGKTTMLLVLARDALQRAEQDTRQPIPVVFNLSSWEGKVTGLADWLVHELNGKYQIPRKIGRAWIDDNRLLLLLDGLDEVEPTQRVACIEAINYFRLYYGLTDIAVCSRLFEYEALSIQLKLEGAVLLQPLDRQQINKYLAAAGPRLATLRALLSQETILQELAQSPLMLNIMSLAYQDGPGKLFTSPASDSLEMYRDHLFAKYVEQMLERRTNKQTYSANQTAQWLAWLASRMVHQSQTLFLLEQIEPAWLGRDTNQYKLYGLLARLIGGLLGISLVSVLGGLIGGLISSEIGASFNFDWELGLIGGLIGWYIGDNYSSSDKITIVERLIWSWKSVRKNYRVIVAISLLATAVVGLFFVIPFGWAIGIFVTVLGGAIILFIVTFVSGLTAVDIETKTLPNQGVWQSGKSAFTMGIALSLITFFIFDAFGGILGLVVAINQKDLALLPWTLKGIEHLVGEAAIFGLIMGLSGGLLYGGFAFIQHYLLRIILYINNLIPRHYVNFLDYGVERILLQKVGGGYIFIHRLLLEYFAGLEGARQPGQIRSKIPLAVSRWGSWLSNVGLSRGILKYIQLLALAVSIVVYGPPVFSRVTAVTANSRASEYRAANKLDEALAGYDRAIELNPNYARAYSNRARTYQLAGNYEAAISDYNMAIELGIKDEKVYFSRGRVYELIGELELAKLDYHQAIEMEPNYARAYYNRAGVYREQYNFVHAVQDYSKAIELGLRNATIYYERGLTYSETEGWEKAILDYSQAIEADPEMSKAYYNRGYAYANSGNPKKAIDDFEHYLTFNITESNEKEISDLIELLRSRSAMND